MITPMLTSTVDRYLRTGSVIGPTSPVDNAWGVGSHVPHIFFVDPDNGNDGNSGTDPDLPLASIGQALTNCVTNRGDVIVARPGSFVENLTVSKNYVHLIAAFEGGYARPDVVPTTGTALTVTGQGFYCKGFRFYSADSDSVIQRGNGFVYKDCVIDGDTGQAATEANLRLKGITDDDSGTASEGLMEDILIRNSNGYGMALDVGDGAGNQVGCTHNTFRRVRFIDNVAEDVIALDTSGGPGTYAAQDNLWDDCSFMSRNKATHVDLDTNLGASNSGNMFQRCFFHDDTIDTTAIKVATANAAIVGCYGLDGVIDGDALD